MVAHISSPRRATHRRDRHGRGLRGRLLPASVPGARSRTQAFDDMVLDAVEQAETRLNRTLGDIEFAVEEVPPELPAFDADVIEDGDVPLARLLPGRDTGRNRIAPRIVIYRWPLEARAGDRGELSHIVSEVILEQVAKLLGLDPEEI